jgi:hypothetical protein
MKEDCIGSQGPQPTVALEEEEKKEKRYNPTRSSPWQ